MVFRKRKGPGNERRRAGKNTNYHRELKEDRKTDGENGKRQGWRQGGGGGLSSLCPSLV